MCAQRADSVRVAYEKNKRWAAKNVAAGLCPSCGKPASPFYYCTEHRETKRLLRFRAIKAAHPEHGASRCARPKIRSRNGWVFAPMSVGEIALLLSLQPVDLDWMLRAKYRPFTAEENAEYGELVRISGHCCKECNKRFEKQRFPISACSLSCYLTHLARWHRRNQRIPAEAREILDRLWNIRTAAERQYSATSAEEREERRWLAEAKKLLRTVRTEASTRSRRPALLQLASAESRRAETSRT